MFDYKSLVESLAVGAHTVTFTKVDGSERVMNCTRDPSLIVVDPVDSEKPVKKVNRGETAVAVFDLDKQQFRSFRVDSVTNVD